MALAALVASGAPSLLTRGYLYGPPVYEIARSRDAALAQLGQALNVLVHKLWSLGSERDLFPF